MYLALGKSVALLHLQSFPYFYEEARTFHQGYGCVCDSDLLDAGQNFSITCGEKGGPWLDQQSRDRDRDRKDSPF